MRWKNCIGEAVALGSICSWIYVFSLSTYHGLTTGNYTVILASNVLYEHYFEFALILIGLILYIKIRRIRFTLHPKRRNKHPDDL